MAWKKSGESLALFSVLVVVLRPLGHCAVLRGEEKPDSVNVLNVNTPASLLVGQGGSEKPESKLRPGKLIIGAPEDYSNIPESLKSGTGSLLDSDYQSDQADWSGLQHLQGSVSGFGGSNSPAVQKLLGMRPKVDCDEETMMLKVHGGVGAFGFGLLIDRVFKSYKKHNSSTNEVQMILGNLSKHATAVWAGIFQQIGSVCRSYAIKSFKWHEQVLGSLIESQCQLEYTPSFPGSVPPLPLSRMPSDCGLHIQKTLWGLVFIVPYDGCYVAQERDAYILPLRLWGLPAKMSCPLLNLAPSPPSVSCYPNGMIVKTQDVAPVEDLYVKVENEWQPLLKASPKCGYSIVSHSDGVVVSAPYKPCMEAKDGVYSLLMAAKKEFRLYCPSLVPTLPLNLTRPVSPDQNGRVDTSLPMKPLVPFKPLWRDPGPTSVPASSTTPQKVQVPYPQFPDTWYPFFPPRTPTPAPIGERPVLPALPHKPKPVPVTHTSTSRTMLLTPSSDQFDNLDQSPPEIPEQPTQPPPESFPTSLLPDPDSRFPFLYSGGTGPVEHPESVFVQGPWGSYQPQYPERSPVPPPAESVEPPSVSETGSYQTVQPMLPGSIFSQGSRWDYLPQRPQRPAVFPTDVPPQYPQRPPLLPTALPSETFEASSVLGATGTHEAAPQMRPGSVFAQGPPWYYPPQYPQRPPLFPTASPSETFEASSVLSATGTHEAAPQMRPGSVFAQGPPWYYPPQYPQRPPLFPTASPSETFEASSVLSATGTHEAAPQMRPGSVFAQGPQWYYPPQYPQRPPLFPTASPSETFEASSVLSATGTHEAAPQMRPGSVFAQGPQWYYPPQYPQRPPLLPTVAPSEPPEAFSVMGATGSHEAAPQMHLGTAFAQGSQWYSPKYPSRPADFPIAGHSESSETFSVLGGAVSSYQAVSNMSKPLGYSQCCPSPVLYSNCCPPSVSYHQHNHHHFGLLYPAFNRGTSRSTRKLTSKASSHSAHSVSENQIVPMQATGNYIQRSGALPIQIEIPQAAAKPSENLFSSSHHRSWSVKPTVRPKMVPVPFIPSTKRPWTGHVAPLLSPSYKPLNAGPHPYGSHHKPKPGSSTNLGPEYSTASPPSSQNARLAPEERRHPPVPTSRQTNPALSQPNSRDRVDYFPTDLYNKPPMYFSQAKIPLAMPRGFPMRPEPQKQDPKLLEPSQSLPKQTHGPELPVQPNAKPQEQVPSAPDGLAGVLSHDHETEDSSMPHLKVVTRPFSTHWIPVVPPKQAKQMSVGPLGRPPHIYRPHGAI